MRKSQASINQWIREQEARLGIKDKVVVNSNVLTGAALPTVTVYPGPLVIERLAHYGADKKIANDPAYDAMCARTDAMLTEIIKAGIPALPRTKSTRRARVPHARIFAND